MVALPADVKCLKTGRTSSCRAKPSKAMRPFDSEVHDCVLSSIRHLTELQECWAQCSHLLAVIQSHSNLVWVNTSMGEIESKSQPSYAKLCQVTMSAEDRLRRLQA